MHPLPPQAYTKDTLVKAYSWLQTQSESIKELATNPEILVSLYLKARLNGESSLERPSIQNFKNELKNLAGMMGEFDSSEMHSVTAQPAPQQSTMTVTTSVSTPAPNANPPQPAAQQQMQQRAPEWDTRSYAMVREVKENFNLSTDQEALRLLISVGYKKLTSLS